jgi:putative transcriptional regulator
MASNSSRGSRSRTRPADRNPPSGPDARADEAPSLTGHFLIAMPGMGDPNFARGITFICQHGQDGAMGLIVNRLSDYRLGDVL